MTRTGLWKRFMGLFILISVMVPLLVFNATAATPEEQLAKLEAAAKQEGKLTLYGGAYAGDWGAKVQKYWLDRYGVKIETVSARAVQINEKLIAENALGKMVADGAAGISWLSYPLWGTGIIKRLGPDNLPELQKYSPSDRKVFPLDPLPGGGNIILNAFTPFTIFINTKLVSPADEPKSWKDLLNPKWKGKITIASPTTIGTIYFPFIAFGPDGTNELPLDFWKALGNQAVIIADIGDAQQRTASGEFAISLEADTQAQTTLFKAGAPVKVIEMAEGTVALSGAGHMVVNKANSPNAALLFANWYLSKEGSQFWADERPQIPLRSDVIPTKPMPKEVVPMPFKKIIGLKDTQIDIMNKYKADKYLEKLWGK